jgi:hypothetical protein
MHVLYMKCLYVQNCRCERSDSLTAVTLCPAVKLPMCEMAVLPLFEGRQLKCCLVLTSLHGVTWVLGARFMQEESGPYDTVEPCAICNQTVPVFMYQTVQ